GVGCFFAGDGDAGADGVEAGEADRPDEREPVDADRSLQVERPGNEVWNFFLGVPFGGFFLFEMMKHLPIHPVQYLLVGFGLAIFFLLLVSFSEHMAFGFAYLIASIGCIGLLTFYLSFVLRSTARGIGFGAMLTSFYAAIYGLLISEDNALILGSLMLFFLLAG